MKVTNSQFITSEKELRKEMMSMINSLYKQLYSERAKKGWVTRRKHNNKKEDLK